VQTQSTGPGSDDFTTFMRAYQDMVFSTAARLAGNDAQAQDIAQETFIRAFENFQQLKSSATPGGWLKTVATNLSINYLTRHRRRWRLFSDLQPSTAEEGEETPFECAVPDTLLQDLSVVQRGELIQAALRRLPEHQRVPLVLYHFDEMSYQDIAVRLKVSLTKVKTDIRRGRAALLPSLAIGVAHETLED
jgi:RNA polymerase sigma-70 factor, ECF subfamily